ncbi:MAG: type II secretion system protein [Candidatus Daviesbacteria bacterium]
MKKFLPKTSKNPQGFTLIELLVVIAILAVLAVIGLSVFSGLTGKGNDTRRSSDMKGVSDALEVTRSKINASIYVPVDGTSFGGGTIPREPATRTEHYCFSSGTSAIANPADFTGSACPGGWTDLNAATIITPAGCTGGAGSITGCTATYFKVCTMNDASVTPRAVICQGSKQ